MSKALSYKQNNKACGKVFLFPVGAVVFCRQSRGNPVSFITPGERTAFTVTAHTHIAKVQKKHLRSE